MHKLMPLAALAALIVSAATTSNSAPIVRTLFPADPAIAKGTGSHCETDGCTQPPTCVGIVHPDYPWYVLYYEKTTWHKHNECRFAWSGNCTNLGDVPCRTVEHWSGSGCTGTLTYSQTYNSSSCNPVEPPEEGG